MTVNTESLLSIVMGGIAFQTPDDFDEAPQAEQGRSFTLFSNKDEALKRPDSIVENYILVFKESVRGLTVGAPVDLRGITVGEVTKIKAELDTATKNVAMAVQIRFYPERLKPRSQPSSDQKSISDSHKLLRMPWLKVFGHSLKVAACLPASSMLPWISFQKQRRLKSTGVGILLSCLPLVAIWRSSRPH